MSEIVIGIAKTLTAFDDASVGTKVTTPGAFMEILQDVVMNASEKFKMRQIQMLDMPSDAYHTVRSGVRSTEGLAAQDLHIRKYRGEWELFALPPPHRGLFSFMNVLMYTIEAYASDDDVGVIEAEELRDEGVTHVLVTIHAGVGSLSYRRLVTTLANGENFDELQRLAQETVEYEKKWRVVADVEPERTLPHVDINIFKGGVQISGASQS